MVAIQIREVPEDVRQALADRAQARGQSLQQFLLTLVTDEARRSVNVAVLDRFENRDDGIRLTPEQAAENTDHAGREDSLARVGEQ